MHSVLQKIKKDRCLGKIYRGYHSQWYDSMSGKIGFKTGLTPLKRKSCKGCEQCNWLDENLDFFYDDEGFVRELESIEHGKLYYIDFVVTGHDYESGLIDEWHLEVKKYKEISNEQQS